MAMDSSHKGHNLNGKQKYMEDSQVRVVPFANGGQKTHKKKQSAFWMCEKYCISLLKLFGGQKGIQK
jgi:hypothetical protein